jgi:hypothetical protein
MIDTGAPLKGNAHDWHWLSFAPSPQQGEGGVRG